jgi:hypothetical protein
VSGSRCLEGAYCLHSQGLTILFHLTLVNEGSMFFKTLGSTYPTIGCHILEDWNLQTNRCGNFRTHIKLYEYSLVDMFLQTLAPTYQLYDITSQKTIYSFIHSFHIPEIQIRQHSLWIWNKSKHNSKSQYRQYKSKKYNTQHSHIQNTIPKRTIECITLENTKHV